MTEWQPYDTRPTDMRWVMVRYPFCDDGEMHRSGPSRFFNAKGGLYSDPAKTFWRPLTKAEDALCRYGDGTGVAFDARDGSTAVLKSGMVVQSERLVR